jgi:uncharacterized cupin superfamily protein
MGIAHMAETRTYDITDPGLGCRWTNLGGAIGSVNVGLRRIEVPAGERSTPAHAHSAEEEVFYVLAGRGLLWQDGATTRVGPGDCVVHRAGPVAHTLRADDGGLDVLVFAERLKAEFCVLPRTGWGWLGDRWADTGGTTSPWAREVALGSPDFPEPGPRPANVVNAATVPGFAVDRPRCAGEGRALARTAGARRTALNRIEIAPGKLGAPEHCHGAIEEIFVVLEGEGTLLLGDDETPVRPGHVVGRPAGSRVAHAFRAGEHAPLVLLGYSDDDPNDIVWYPRSNKIFWRGVGVIGRVEQLGYWDGED